MKLTRKYELEMTADELKAIGRVQREGGIQKAVLDLMFGKEVETEEDEADDETAD